MANKQAAIAFAKKQKDKGNESSDTEAFWYELMQKVLEAPDAYDDKIVKREDKILGEKSTRSKDIVIYKAVEDRFLQSKNHQVQTFQDPKSKAVQIS